MNSSTVTWSLAVDTPEVADIVGDNGVGAARCREFEEQFVVWVSEEKWKWSQATPGNTPGT